MNVTREQIRGFRLRGHHLDRRLPAGGLEAAAGACGVQNSPPGAWETALFLRVEDCARGELERALYQEKRLLQAWSFRGVPAVFPTGDAGVFLAPLAALPGEEPWIYTRGITAALDFAGLTFDGLLSLVEKACRWLEGHTVKSKEELDRVLAALVEEDLPPEKRAAWRAPSMYGSPDRQTVGGAAVSFLLRPCSFRGLVVFGQREENTPTFTAPGRWLGRPLEMGTDGERELVRRFLHCYGPSAPAQFQAWLGCSPRQARRLWDGAAEELVSVETEEGRRWLLAADLEDLKAGEEGDRLLLLGPHDPYLDLRDRDLVLEDRARQRAVWRTVSNPGVILRGGRIIGIWTAKSAGGRLDMELVLWEQAGSDALAELKCRAEEYAAFRGAPIRRLAVRGEM